MVQGTVYTNHHGYPIFPFPNPALTSVSESSNWLYDDDIDRVSVEEAPQGYGGDFGGDGGNVGGGGAGLMAGSNVPGSSGSVSPKEERYTSP